MKPNLIERLENLIESLDALEDTLMDRDLGGDPDWNNAYRIAKEVLTMIDGR